MKPLRVYLDTSVIGGAFDEEFAEDTQALLDRIRVGHIVPVLSEHLDAELLDAPQHVRDLVDELYEGGAEEVALTQETRTLAGAYLAAGVVSERYLSDALHIALATLAKVDVLVSWNFKHMVNLRRIHGYNGVNLIHEYGTLEIRSPKEVTERGNENQDL